MARKKKDTQSLETVEVDTVAVKSVELSYSFDVPKAPSIIDAVAAGKTENDWRKQLEDHRTALEETLKAIRGEAYANFAPIKVWAETLVNKAFESNLDSIEADMSVRVNAVGVIVATMWSFLRSFSTGNFHARLKQSHLDAIEAAKKQKGKKAPDTKGLFDFLGTRTKGIQRTGKFENEQLTGKIHANIVAVDKAGSMYKFADTLFAALESLKFGTMEGDNKAIDLIKSQSKYTGIPPTTLALLVHSAMYSREIKSINESIANYAVNFQNARTPQETEHKKQLQQIAKAASAAARR